MRLARRVRNPLGVGLRQGCNFRQIFARDFCNQARGQALGDRLCFATRDIADDRHHGAGRGVTQLVKIQQIFAREFADGFNFALSRQAIGMRAVDRLGESLIRNAGGLGRRFFDGGDDARLFALHYRLGEFRRGEHGRQYLQSLFAFARRG